MGKPATHNAEWDGSPADGPFPAETPAPSAVGRDQIVDSIFFRPPESLTQEQGQAAARCLFTLIATLTLFVFSWDGQSVLHGRTALAYLVFSLAYLGFVSFHRHAYLWRRYLVVVTDLAMMSFYTASLPHAGMMFYPLYLWIVMGNGFRFGTGMLYYSVLVAIAGFVAAYAYNGMLQTNPGTFVGLSMGLVLMPKFFLVMIKRLEEANRKLKAQKDQAEFMAMHDELTGLPNRACLQAQTQEILARAGRNGNDVIVAFIDLDSFKSINDSFGHETGDRLLRMVADEMQRVMRRQDLISRLGGDEFIVVVEDQPGCPNITSTLERLFSCVGRYYTLDTYQAYVTWSCGIAVFPRDGKNLHTLMKNADTAMYIAKSEGENRYAFYNAEMSDRVGRWRSLQDELRLAIEHDQLRVHYQPILDVTTSRICAAEALVRWQHPEQGLLSPFAFIEVAEKTGLIEPIGEWVTRQAIRVAKHCRSKGLNGFGIHVNVSAHQMKHEDFPRHLTELLAGAGMPPDVIRLEVTEGALMGNLERAKQMLEQLRESGINIALDDFGTGYSSLSYLKLLPVDTIKIDKSFADDIPGDKRSSALVDSILAIGSLLDCEIIAEGVETAEQRDWLHAHGCRYMQGYLFSRPLPEHEFLALIDQQAADTPAQAIAATHES